jgi:hypothetical protein
MNATDGRKLIEAVLNERRCRVVKMGLGGATIAETAKALRDRKTHGVGYHQGIQVRRLVGGNRSA